MLSFPSRWCADSAREGSHDESSGRDGCSACKRLLLHRQYKQRANARPSPREQRGRVTPTYVSLYLEVTVNRPAADVCQRLGGYCAVAEWMKTPCAITSGKDGELGAVRTLGIGNDADSQVAERERILTALMTTQWNRSRAAASLRWSRMTLYRKMARYSIASPSRSRTK